MIRINLLPVRVFRRKENVRRQVSIFILTVLFLVGVMGFLFVKNNNALTEKLDEKKKAADRVATLQKKVKEVRELEEERTKIQEKLRVISNLEKRRIGPIRVLDELSRRMPNQRAFLLSLVQAKNKLALKGLAMDNSTVAVIIQQLEASEFLQNVELERTAQEIRQELRLKGFTISAEIFLQEEEKPEEATKKK